MTNFMVRYHADDIEKMVRFFAEIKASGADEITRQEKGCVRYEYFFPVEQLLNMQANAAAANGDNAANSESGNDPAVKGEVEMLLWEQWESREDQEAHTKAPHFKIFGELKEKYGITAEFMVQDIAE